ncbi:hypothetical protein ES703_60200 [subsurface metagenome]
MSNAAGHARLALRDSVESVACIGENMARFTSRLGERQIQNEGDAAQGSGEVF